MSTQINKCYRYLGIFLLLPIVATSAIQAQDQIQFSLSSEVSRVPAGSDFEVALEARISPGWKLYSMTQPEGGPIPTTIEIPSNPVFSLAGSVIQPPLETTFDPNFELETEWVKGDVEFLIPVRVADNARAGTAPLTAAVRFMLCSDTMCLPPQTRTVELSLEISAPPSGKTAASLPPLSLGLSSGAPGAKIEFELSYSGEAVSSGTPAQAILSVFVQEGWHLYSLTQPAGGPIPTTIEIPDNPSFQLAGPIQQPEFSIVFDKTFEIDAEYIDGTGEFLIPFEPKPGTALGNFELPVQVRFMVCSDTMCLPPQTRRLTTLVEIARVSPAASAPGQTLAVPSGQEAGADNTITEEDSSDSSGEIPTSVFGYIAFAMAMGGLALLTPCVFPMIPITVSYFTKREAVSRGRAIKEAGLYAGGIVLTFTVLGFALTFLLGAGGINRLAASPVINLIIAAVFILFALSLFGVLEIGLPSRWVNAIDRKSAGARGILGILLMALTFSLTSFTCTVPFVGTVMVAALQGDWLWSLVGVTSFACVFAAPFFMLAIFPSWLQSLPKSGNWMNSVKITMGFLELAAAMKFISNIDLVFQWEFLTRPVFITVWLSLALVTSVYLLGWFRFPHETKTESIGAFRVLSAVLFLAVSFYLMRGLVGFPLGELECQVRRSRS